MPSDAQRRSALKWQKNNRDHINAKNRKRRSELKNEVVSWYGGLCSCCGENHIEFLAIDHINGSGNSHRTTVSHGRGGWMFYAWLKRNNYGNNILDTQRKEI